MAVWRAGPPQKQWTGRVISNFEMSRQALLDGRGFQRNPDKCETLNSFLAGWFRVREPGSAEEVGPGRPLLLWAKSLGFLRPSDLTSEGRCAVGDWAAPLGTTQVSQA